MRWPAVISLPKKTLCPILVLTLGGALAAQASLSADRYRMEVGQPPVRALRLVDVNGDGLLDLIRLAEQGLSVLLQDAAGRFRPDLSSDVSPPTGSFFSDLATGSLYPHPQPNDQLPDVALLGGDGQVEILRNTGPGGLTAISPSPVSPPFKAPASQVLVADLDGLFGDDVLVLLDGAPPLIFLANGQEAWFWEHGREAHPRQIETFFSQQNPERRVAQLG